MRKRTAKFLSPGRVQWMVLAGFVLVTKALGDASTAAPAGKVFHVKEFGAIGDGKTDDTSALLRTIEAASSATPRGIVYIDSGIYRYAGNISIKSLSVKGEGPDRSIVEGIDAEHTAWTLSGHEPQIKDLRIRCAGEIGRRDSHPEATGIHVSNADGFSLFNVRVGPVSSAGIIVRNSGGTIQHPATIENCRIEDSRADGIHLTNGSHDIEVINNQVQRSGDDFIAVVSPHKGKICERIKITKNQVSTHDHGRGISVVGGQEIAIEDNKITDSGAAGIYIASELNYDTYGCAKITISGNWIHNANLIGPASHAAIHLIGANRGIRAIVDVSIRDNTVVDAGRSGIYIGPFCRNVDVSGNRLSGIKTDGFVIGPKVTDISLGSLDVTRGVNTVISCGEYAVHVDPAESSGYLKIERLNLEAINSRALGYVDAINIGRRGTFRQVSIRGTRWNAPSGTTVERFVESQSPIADFGDNTANIPIKNAIATTPN